MVQLRVVRNEMGIILINKEINNKRVLGFKTLPEAELQSYVITPRAEFSLVAQFFLCIVCQFCDSRLVIFVVLWCVTVQLTRTYVSDDSRPLIKILVNR